MRRRCGKPAWGLSAAPAASVRVLLAAAVLFVAAVSAPPCVPAAGSGERAPRVPVRHVTLSGTVRLTGSEPFVRTVLAAADGTVYLFEGDDAERLRPFAGRLVVVAGTVTERILTSADGKYRIVERVLRDVETRGPPPEAADTRRAR